MATTTKQNEIIQITERDHARARSGMYCGSSEVDEHGRNSESLLTIIREATDNSIDEIKLDRGDTIWVAKDKIAKPELSFEEDISYIKKWFSYLVADNCGGIPIKKTTNLKGEEITMTELAVANFRAGSKFDSENRKDVDFIGMNGIGVSATNFLSTQFCIYSNLGCHSIEESTQFVQDLVKKYKIKKADLKNWYYKLSYEFGLKVSEDIVEHDEVLDKFKKDKPSTIVWFIPDPQIHNTVDADIPVTFRYMKYLNPNLHFYVNWKEDKDIPQSYNFSEKVVAVRENVANDKLTFTYSIGVNKDLKKDATQDFSVNTLSTQEGIHKKLFLGTWSEALCNYFKDKEIIKYTALGLNILCIMQCSEPEFNSQTKTKLSNLPGWRASEIVPELLKSFTKIIRDNEEVFIKYYELIKEYWEARQNVGKLKELKKQLADVTSGGKSASSYLPKKILDCPCKDRTRAELYFTEGLSAAGALAKARAGLDNIAIMPLRGKIRNIVGESPDVSLKNEEISDITNACGGIDDVHLPTEKLHYGKYIICSDADADGFQIGALLLGALMQNHKFLFGTKENDYRDSRVFVAIAPLFAFFNVDKTKKNQYFYSGQEAEATEFSKKHKYSNYKRFKGLGELNPDELKDIYLNEANRKLVQIIPENIEEALDLISPAGKDLRKKLLIDNGVYV